MRFTKKCGSTPCDRRLDRRKVASAAVLAALFLTATVTQANAASFVINHGLSGLQMAVTVVDSPIAGLIGTTPITFDPQASLGDGQGLQLLATPTGNSDSAYLTGTINATIAAGGITLNSGSSIVPDTTGVYFPNHVGTTDPPGPFPGAPPLAGNFGFIAPAVLGTTVAMYNGMSFDFGVPAQATPTGIGPSSPPILVPGPTAQFGLGVPNTAMPLSGGTTGTFTLTGNGMHFGAGTVSSFLNAGNTFASTDGIAGLPAMFGLTNVPVGGGFSPIFTGANMGSLSLDGQTLTIPVSSNIGIIIADAQVVGGKKGSPPFIYEILSFEGTIVATLVPEPSTVTLLGFGAVGLLCSAWRARKRKA